VPVGEADVGLAGAGTVIAVEPLAAFVPDQPPLAVQGVAPLVLVDDHVSVTLVPVSAVVALNDIAAVGNELTVSTADLVSEPALLLQVNVYVNVPAVPFTPVEVVPLNPCAPVQALLAVQLVPVVLATDQLSVELAPVAIVVGLRLIVITGGLLAGPELDVMVIVAVPGVGLELVQLRLYVYEPAPRAPVETTFEVVVPVVDLAPDQLPDAVQLDGEFVEDHRILVLPPAVTL
jgi:hypothetical protein